MLHYPITAIIGDLGAGKTLFLTYLADRYYKEGLNVFANYELLKTPYTPLDFKELATFPKHVKNGVLLMDEGHIDGDAYNFLRKGVRDMGKFITQIRKRKLILFFTTQDFASIFIRLRELTNYIMLIEPVTMTGISSVTTYDKRNGMLLVHKRIYKLDKYFNAYHTEEIIDTENHEMDGDDLDGLEMEEF